MGAQAFIPTSVAPLIALQILEYVAGGGRYFPIDGLLHVPFVMEAKNKRHLTPRQSVVLKKLQEGKSNKLIGRELDLAEATVKIHVRQIMRRLGATNRTQAALMRPL